MTLLTRRLDPDIHAMLPLLDIRLAAPWTAQSVRTAVSQPLGAQESAADDTVIVSEQMIGGAPARVYRAGVAPQPTILYLHGGGWVAGDLDSHDYIPRHIARTVGAIVVSLDYALAPERPFPNGLTDCQNALQAIASDIQAFGGDLRALALAGDSAGANIVAAIALECRASLPPLVAQLLIYPALDLTGRFADPHVNRFYPSRASNAEGPLLRTALMAWFAEQYCSIAEAATVHASPLRAPRLDGAPPAVIAVAQCDPLRDEGLAYARRLRDAGVETHVHEGVGLVHGYFRLTPKCAAASREAENVVADFNRLIRARRGGDLP